MPGYVTQDPSHGTVLNGTSAIQCNNGVLGTSAGKAQDTLLTGVYIPLAATASTLTIAGLTDQTGTPRNLLISGQTTVDVNVFFDPPILNDAAAFVFTPSASNLIVVFTRAFNSGQ